MNRAILRISLACLAMFVLLLINVNYVQAFETTRLAGESGNTRIFDQQFSFQRGTILAGNLKIAESQLVKGTDTYRRVYPYGKIYAAVTGYDSIYGQSGIEQAENSMLDGSDPRLAVRNFTALLTGKQKQGATVQLTINPVAQAAAYNALAQGTHGHAAGLVALDPSTGAILALASNPTFDPNSLATLDGSKLDKIDNQLLNDKSQPLLNRAIQVTYPPGSTFKIVTSAAAFSTGKVANTTSTIPAPSPLRLPNGNHLVNDNGELCGDGNPSIIQAFWMSCNTAFGGLGIKLTAPVLRQYSTRFGMNSPLSIPLAVAPSVLPEKRGLDRPVADRVHRYRAVRRPGDAVARGHVRRDRRQWRHADEALPGPAGARPRPVPDPDTDDDRAQPCGKPEDSGLPAGHDVPGHPQSRRDSDRNGRAPDNRQPHD